MRHQRRPAAAAAAAAMAGRDRSDYFKIPSLFWIVTVTLGVSYFTCIVFAPEKIPFQYLGPFGTFCKYLVDNHAHIMDKGWWACLAVHVFEALIALRVCSDRGITNMASRCLWFVQTFLFGYASLGLLFNYDPRRPKQH